MRRNAAAAGTPAPGHSGLRADCRNCFALCCVAPALSVSADFAIDKPAGKPCPSLRSDFRCAIHQHLRQEGFPGCAAYDCFGAGQKVSQVTFEGRDWRSPPAAGLMLRVFPVMRQLHELLWYLTEALTLRPARSLRPELRRALEETEGITHGGPQSLLDLDLDAPRARVNALLVRASELVREEARRPGRDRRGADLIGADLKGADLRGADLRSAHLIGADLRNADLRSADLIGADLRGARLSGADLSSSIFVTQHQMNAARGDALTRIPRLLDRPAHWSRSHEARPTA